MNTPKTVFVGLFIVLAVVLMISTSAFVHVYAFKLTSDSYDDGFKRGEKDAKCDWNRCHGHGKDDSCPRGHTVVYCDGYRAGYNEAWDTMKENGVASDANGNICNLGPDHDMCPGH